MVNPITYWALPDAVEREGTNSPTRRRRSQVEYTVERLECGCLLYTMASGVDSDAVSLDGANNVNASLTDRHD